MLVIIFGFIFFSKFILPLKPLLFFNKRPQYEHTAAKSILISEDHANLRFYQLFPSLYPISNLIMQGEKRVYLNLITK